MATETKSSGETKKIRATQPLEWDVSVRMKGASTPCADKIYNKLRQVWAFDVASKYTERSVQIQVFRGKAIPVPGITMLQLADMLAVYTWMYRGKHTMDFPFRLEITIECESFQLELAYFAESRREIFQLIEEYITEG